MARQVDVAGFDVVLIETVGVGQSEIEVVALADTSVVLLASGTGNGVLEQLRARLGDVGGATALPELAERVAAGELDPYRAADELTVSLGLN